VASILEGSVRRAGHTIRVTAQLNDAVSGFHVWSQTYDRDQGDILKLQTEIAEAVATALKVTLLGNIATKVEVGGTRNPEAFDAFLRAMAMFHLHDRENLESLLPPLAEALRGDPDYALAYYARSVVFQGIGDRDFTRESLSRSEAVARREKYFSLAEVDARRAVALAPEMPEGHLALAYVYEGRLELPAANQEYERALAFGPGSARVLGNYGGFATLMGHADKGLAAVRRAVVLDPLNPASHLHLALSAYYARRYPETLRAFEELALLDPDYYQTSWIGRTYYALGEFEKARAACERVTVTDYGGHESCLIMVYDKLGRHVDAEALLEKLQRSRGMADSYLYAGIYAQRGDTAKALEWLETAVRVGDNNLIYMKASPLLDPLRDEPRFQAVLRELKFPD
jgi:Tfp pilus assembly protein PilF